jgi:regulatory protein
MAVITGIVPSPRKPGRFDVLVDKRLEATVSLATVERLGLAIGRPYDDRLRADVQREAAVLSTYDRALNMLALRARASRELRRQLLRKGEPADQVDAAIERLSAAGFLDDAAFARQLARSKVGAGMSRRRIQRELGRRGVAHDVGDAAIAEVFAEEDVDEATVVEQAARKKLRSLGSVDPETRNRRLYAFLARRGYDLDDIRRAISSVGGAEVDATE